MKIRFTEARGVSPGLIGFLEYTTEDFQYNDIALRISKANRLYLLFPSKKVNSKNKQIYHPINDIQYSALLTAALTLVEVAAAVQRRISADEA